MMNLENELKDALRRKSPPPDFAARVLRRIENSGANDARPVLQRWQAIAAAVTMTALLGGWAAREAAHRRMEGERAREEVLTALRITSEKLRTAQQHVKQIGSANE